VDDLNGTCVSGHGGRQRRFGSFNTKTEAREFYEKAKQEQRLDRFFPERFQHGAQESVEGFFERYKITRLTRKDQRGERCFVEFWKRRFKGQRLNAITTSTA
jgi:hypothetical protein